LLVTCLLHLGGTFLVRVRFFERPSFVRVTSPNSEYPGSFEKERLMHYIQLRTAGSTSVGNHSIRSCFDSSDR
jgi:hypothetical protein